jgi:hypothetical protein
MKLIQKHVVSTSGHSSLMLPWDSKILGVSTHFGLPYIHALVDTTLCLYEYEFSVWGEGSEVTRDLKDFTYLGMGMVDTFAWHIFYRIRK